MTIELKDKERIILDYDLGNTSNKYDGYFCINTVPFNCNCRDDPWIFIHYDSKVVVWQEKDDPKLLDFAHKTQALGMNPKIIEYEHIVGPAISWDDIPNGAEIG